MQDGGNTSHLMFCSRWAISVPGKRTFPSIPHLLPFNDDLSAFGSTYCLQLSRLPFWYRVRRLAFIDEKSQLPYFILSETHKQISMLTANHLIVPS